MNQEKSYEGTKLDGEVARGLGAGGGNASNGMVKKRPPKEYRIQGCTSDRKQTNSLSYLFSRQKTGPRNKCLSQAKGEVLD